MDITPSFDPSATKHYTYMGTARRYWKEYLGVFAAFFCAFAFIFRDLLWAIPDVLNGTSVVSFDEMAPIFDMKSQFWDQVRGEFSNLTHEYEFRVRYSVLTTWMRYYTIVPITIIASITLSSFLCFTGLVPFLRNLANAGDRIVLVYGSAMSVLLFNLILTYAKITHFYTLILGFNLFCISLFLLLSAAFIDRRHPVWLLIAAHLSAVINPAVHYVVLYSIISVMLSFYLLFKRDTELFSGKGRWARYCMFNALLITCTILPYVILTKFFFLSGFGELSDAVPVSHFLIESSSIPLLKQISLDIVSIVDKYIYGEYNVPFARISNIFYTCIALLPLLPSLRNSANKGGRSALTFVGILLPFSVWFTFGYTQVPYLPTFHNFLAGIVQLLYPLPLTITDLAAKLCSTLIQILRFPHRFQFITFAAVMTLLPLGIMIAADKLKQATGYARKNIIVRCIIACLAGMLFFLPLLSNWDYRTAFFSGNLNQFVTPYPMADLRGVKDNLERLPIGKTIVFPPSEAEKRVMDSNGVPHRFIDKFYIYYLNFPSYYYGASGDISTKNVFFSFLWSLLQGDGHWLETMKTQQIRYIVINKKTISTAAFNSSQLTMLRSALQDNMDDLPNAFAKRYENEGYALYEFTADMSPNPTKDTETPWTSLLCTDKTMQDMLSSGDDEKEKLDGYATDHPDSFFRPDVSNQAFTERIVPSTLYFGTIYSMFSVLNYGKYNFLHMIIPGTSDTITGSFVGVPDSTTIKIATSVPMDGEYELYLRAMPTRNRLSINVQNILRTDIQANGEKTTYIDTSTIRSYKPRIIDVSSITIDDLPSYIPHKILPISSEYSYIKVGKVMLKRGKQWVYLEKKDGNPFVLEGALLLPVTQ